MHQTFFLFLPLFALYLLSECDLFNMSCRLFKIFLGPSKILRNFSWLINIYLKYYMTPTKTLRAPSPPPRYLMYGP